MIFGCFILNYNDSTRSIELANKLAECDLINFVVIFDNGSEPDLKEILLTAKKSEKIKIFYSCNNLGYNKGTNEGLRKCSKFNPDYIFVCNSDIDVDENILITMADGIKKENDISIVGTDYLEKERRMSGAYNYPKFAEQFANVSGLSKIYKGNRKLDLVKISENLFLADYIRGSLFLANYKDISNVGFYDEDFFLYFAEVSLAKKLKRKNKKICYLPDLFYLHNHIYNKNNELKKFKIFYNDLILYWKKYEKLNFIKRSLFFFAFIVGLILRFMFKH